MTTEGEFAEIVKYAICKKCDENLWESVRKRIGLGEFGG